MLLSEMKLIGKVQFEMAEVACLCVINEEYNTFVCRIKSDVLSQGFSCA